MAIDNKYIIDCLKQRLKTLLIIVVSCFAYGTYAQASSASISKKLPKHVFIKIIDSVSTMVINDATAFRHVDLPSRLIANFNSYIKDSAVSNVEGLKTKVYYAYTLQDGQILNGDIYWNDTKSYIIFSADDRKYINYFSRDGVEQLKKLFKF